MRIKTETPLGGKASLYLTKLNKNGAIHLKPDDSTLEFYPVGYTKSGSRGDNRQTVLKRLWGIAVLLGTENQLFPFNKVQHNIKLIPTTKNSKDPNALYVVIDSASPNSKMSTVDGMDIGWCPLRISKQVKEHLKMIRGGRILRIRKDFHGKYFTAKVILGYGENTSIIGTNADDGSRFMDMMEEISE